ncbi:transglutaminaseTgpA domain-containing protein [Brachybacterium massiliense]|uniref:transglutaminase family protein n=1 Tax=Brachybacterium massiliense TaxID=1755098 RepID=UPI002481DC91|nr:transglutaminase domain-containing protein [Brachybacterium massiliense]
MLERWQDPNAPALGPVMIDDDVSVRRSLLQQQDTEVLRYTTTAENPSYLRLRSLNTFDGEAYRGDVEGEALALGLAAFSDSRDDGVPVHGSADDFIETDVEVTSYAGDRLPVPDNVRSVEFADSELDETVVVQPSQGEIALARGQTALVGQEYTIRSEQRTSSADALRSVDPAVFDQPFDAGYTSREEVPETAAELADTIAESARADNAFDTAVAYQDYFRNTFAYSLTVNTAPGEDPLESFLADRIGYCEQFAAAFALMMTSQGYPSRVVIGFTAGEQDGNQWTVSAKNAHAWPEVWFGPEHGWVRFEPTPAAAANGVSTPGVTDAAAQQDTPEARGDEEPTQEEPTEEEPTSEEDTTEESSSEEGTTEEESDEGGTGPSEETVQRIEGGVVTTLALGALLAAAAALTVLVIRRRRAHAREQRWAALFEGGTGDGAGTALGAERIHRRAGALAWSEITRELAVRETAIRWLAITGAWGRPPTHIALDPTLPPARALEDLLEQIDAGELEVSEEQRAAAARIAAAYTSAIYAPARRRVPPAPRCRSGGMRGL